MSREKIRKRRVWKGALLGACLLAFGHTVKAFVPESVSLKGEGNKVEVLMSPVEKDTVSLQLSMEVEVTKGTSDASVSFAFDPGLPGGVKQYRYQEETGTLTVYISGDGSESLPEGADFSLGSVVLNSENGASAEATVRVKTDSLKVVNRGYDLQVREEIYAPSEGKAVVGSVKETPEQPPAEPEPVPEPKEPSVEDQEDNPEENGGRKPGTHVSSGDSANEDKESYGSEFIPEQKTRPSVGIRVGAGQKSPGQKNPSDPQLPKAEAETTEDEPYPVEEAAADWEDPFESDAGETQAERRDRDTEETVDNLTFWGIVAALLAGAFVILLMLLEYRRKEEKKRWKKKKKVKK